MKVKIQDIVNKVIYFLTDEDCNDDVEGFKYTKDGFMIFLKGNYLVGFDNELNKYLNNLEELLQKEDEYSQIVPYIKSYKGKIVFYVEINTKVGF